MTYKHFKHSFITALKYSPSPNSFSLKDCSKSLVSFYKEHHISSLVDALYTIYEPLALYIGHTALCNILKSYAKEHPPCDTRMCMYGKTFPFYLKEYPAYCKECAWFCLHLHNVLWHTYTEAKKEPFILRRASILRTKHDVHTCLTSKNLPKPGTYYYFFSCSEGSASYTLMSKIEYDFLSSCQKPITYKTILSTLGHQYSKETLTYLWQHYTPYFSSVSSLE